MVSEATIKVVELILYKRYKSSITSAINFLMPQLIFLLGEVRPGMLWLQFVMFVLMTSLALFFWYRGRKYYRLYKSIRSKAGTETFNQWVLDNIG